MTKNGDVITFNASDVTYYAIILKNDLHHIHLHAAGEDFDDVHSITKNLYEELEKEIDELAEIAISEGFEMDNFSNAKDHIINDTWELETANTYSFTDMTKAIAHKCGIFLDVISSTELKNNADKIYLDYLKYFWNKEVNYKNVGRELKI